MDITRLKVMFYIGELFHTKGFKIRSREKEKRHYYDSVLLEKMNLCVHAFSS